MCWFLIGRGRRVEVEEKVEEKGAVLEFGAVVYDLRKGEQRKR